MASACPIVKRSSTVTTLPLTSTASGACARASAGAAPTASASRTARLNHTRMSDPPGDLRSASARLHAPLLEGSGGRRRGDELDERLGGVCFPCPGHDAAG